MEVLLGECGPRAGSGRWSAAGSHLCRQDHRPAAFQAQGEIQHAEVRQPGSLAERPLFLFHMFISVDVIVLVEVFYSCSGTEGPHESTSRIRG